MNFEDIFTKTFYGNTITNWAISLAIIVGAIVVGKIAYWFLSKVMKKITLKSKSKLDDILIDMMEEPLVVVVVLLGIWYGLRRLTFSDGLDEFVAHSMQAAVILTVTWMIVRLLDALIQQYIVPLTAQSETDLDDMILPVVRKASRAMIWALGIIVALNNAGIEIAPLIAGLGIGGLALAMAAKDTVANFFGGFTIFTDKPFKVGDRIKVDEFDGSIYEVGLRSSRMRTLEGRMVTIPNARIADSMIENVSEEPTRKVVNKLGLVYDVDADQIRLAIELLNGIGKESSAYIDDNIICGFTGFGDSALELLFIYYIKSGEDIIGVQTDINLKIMEKFAANNLDFAYPSQTIYTKSID